MLLVGLTTPSLPAQVDNIICLDNNHPHMIDLGLPSGTKWACCNVDASKPEDFGGYYAWGETETKEYYDWDTYIYCDGSRETCHHIGDNIAGTKYDVAHVKWGNPWMMPSIDQIQELFDNCTYTPTTLNSVFGYLVTGPNGSAFFLPESGCRISDSFEGGGNSWTSSLNQAAGEYHAHYLTMEYGSSSFYRVRCTGFTVRPVCTADSIQDINVNHDTRHGIVVFSHGGKDTLCINNINLNNLSHSEDELTIVCHDTVMARIIADVDSVSIIKLPDCIVIEQGIGDWSEMRICNDGFVALTKMERENVPSEMMMMCPDDSLGAVFSKISFDENSYPTEITMNEYKLLVDWIGDTQFNLTILSPDSISYRFDSLTYTVEPSDYGRRLVPDIDKKPWLTRVGGILQTVGGGIEIAKGCCLIFGSGAATIGSGGSSLPISSIGIALGLVDVIAGSQTLTTGILNAFTDAYDNSEPYSPYVSAAYNQIVSAAIEHGTAKLFEKGVFPDDIWPYMAEPKPKYNIHDWFSLFPSLIGGFISKLESPYTWYDLVADVQKNVYTGLAMDTTMNSITVRGYVNPYILESPSEKFETEYGIVIYSEKNPQERYVQNEYDGEGGMFEYIFDELKPNTSYRYFTYYSDMTNHVVAIANIKSFKTLPLLPVIKDFKITNKEYSENAFTHDGVTYDYKFDVALTVEIEDDEGVTDWGYVYRDPNGHDKNISLMNYGTSFTDDRYVYYRNGNISTVTFYVYIKYEEDKTARYGEPIDYYLVSNTCPDENHPHIIDLGLPSGTKWACCNVDAPKPEGNGGRYAWGETREKDYYRWSNYEYRIYDSGYPYGDYYGEYIGDDIAGTEYDVAHVKWGEPWRMPSFEQYFELATKCSGGWTNYNGVYGFVFIGSNGNSIFLPATSSFSSDYFADWFYEGAYWSSTFWYGGDGRFAEYFDFGPYGYGPGWWYDDGEMIGEWKGENYTYRPEGLSIRAVYNSGDFNDEDDEEEEDEYEEDDPTEY